MSISRSVLGNHFHNKILSMHEILQELATTDSYQVRLYDTHLNISAPYETRPEGLAKVAAYMDGANSLGVKIPATQPLVMRYAPGSGGQLQKTISLYVPRAGSEPPPMPSNAGVELEVRAACTFDAVLWVRVSPR